MFTQAALASDMSLGMPVRTAQDTARHLLSGLDDRWQHTQGVARRAAELADLLDADPDVLVTAAWLHDIGYAGCLGVTGFHPLDGADYLVGHGWPVRIAGLVAHHSGARFVAAARGLARALAAYPDEGGPIADALTYADQTVGPRGERVTQQERYAEMLHRHGPQSWNAKADHLRAPYLRAVVGRVEARLSALSYA